MAYRDNTGRVIHNGSSGVQRGSNNRSSPSSISGSSGTLHNSRDSEAHSDDGLTSSFDTLNISRSQEAPGNSGFFKNGSNRFSVLADNGFGNYNDSKATTCEDYVDSDRPIRKNRNTVSTYNVGRGVSGGAYRTSRTWVSPDAQHTQEFLMVRNAMRRLFKNADIAKWKYSDFIAHREAMIASKADKLANQVKMREEEAQLKAPRLSAGAMATLNKHLPGKSNLNMEGNYGRVLGEKTIWCSDWENGKDEIAPWPTFAEAKWEGDDRAKTGVGRFLPLPREQGPQGIPWNQLQVVDQYPIDQVARIPTMEDVYLPVDEIDEDMKHDLLNKDMEEAMDFYLES